MTWLDPFVLIALALCVHAGQRMGLVAALVPFFSVLLASALSVSYGMAVGGALVSAGGGAWAASDGAGRILVLACATLASSALLRGLVRLFLVARLSGPDRLAGALAMALSGALFLALLCDSIVRIPLPSAARLVHGSFAGAFLADRALPEASAWARSGATRALRRLGEPPAPPAASPTAPESRPRARPTAPARRRGGKPPSGKDLTTRTPPGVSQWRSAAGPEASGGAGGSA